MATTATNLTAAWQQVSSVACLITVEEGSALIHITDTAIGGDAAVAAHTLSGVGSSFNVIVDRLVYAKRARDNERATLSVTASTAS